MKKTILINIDLAALLYVCETNNKQLVNGETQIACECFQNGVKIDCEIELAK